MQHGPSTPSDIPWILQNLLFSQTSFNWPTSPFDLCRQLSWMTCLAVLEGILRLFLTVGSKFYWDKTCFFQHLPTLQITLKLHYLISHAKTSFLVNCAGGTQGVQLLDWSNKGQIRAIRLRRVWVHLAPQHLMLKPVNWLIYLLVWANCVKDWTCQCQRNCTGPRSSSIEDTFGSKFTQAGSLG